MAERTIGGGRRHFWQVHDSSPSLTLWQKLGLSIGKCKPGEIHHQFRERVPDYNVPSDSRYSA